MASEGPAGSSPLVHDASYICTCGYQTVAKSSAPPRYCSGCGQLLKTSSLAAKGRLRVLLVDDSKLIRRVVGSLLRQMMCVVQEAHSGAAALEIARGERPDLILTDLIMPEMSGIELIGELQADAALKEIPVAVLTTRGDAHTVSEVMDLGVIAYLLKEEMNGARFRNSLQTCVAAATRFKARRVKHRVVVAEDSKVLREALVHILGEMNCEVTAAADGEEALAYLKKRIPDLLITDVNMPRMDGMELLRIVRADENLKGTPVVMLTSRGDSDTMVRAMQLGVQAYIVKDQTTARELREQLEKQVTAAGVH